MWWRLGWTIPINARARNAVVTSLLFLLFWWVISHTKTRKLPSRISFQFPGRGVLSHAFSTDTPLTHEALKVHNKNNVDVSNQEKLGNVSSINYIARKVTSCNLVMASRTQQHLVTIRTHCYWRIQPMAGIRAPLAHLTTDDTGPAIIVVIYCLALTSSGIAIIRFWLQSYRSIPFEIDDGAYVVANVHISPSESHLEDPSTNSVLTALGHSQHDTMDVCYQFWSRTAYSGPRCQQYWQILQGESSFLAASVSSVLPNTFLTVRICGSVCWNRCHVLRKSSFCLPDRSTRTWRAVDQESSFFVHRSLDGFLPLCIGFSVSFSTTLGLWTSSMSDPWQVTLSYHRLQRHYWCRTFPLDGPQYLEASNAIKETDFGCGFILLKDMVQTWL